MVSQKQLQQLETSTRTIICIIKYSNRTLFNIKGKRHRVYCIYLKNLSRKKTGYG